MTTPLDLPLGMSSWQAVVLLVGLARDKHLLPCPQWNWNILAYQMLGYISHGFTCFLKTLVTLRLILLFWVATINLQLL